MSGAGKRRPSAEDIPAVLLLICEGENPVTASHEIPIGDAIALLDDALSDYANRE